MTNHLHCPEGFLRQTEGSTVLFSLIRRGDACLNFRIKFFFTQLCTRKFASLTALFFIFATPSPQINGFEV